MEGFYDVDGKEMVEILSVVMDHLHLLLKPASIF